MRSTQRERVVVLGGGYAGTMAALRVAGRGRGRIEVTLIDPKDSFVQRLRLHQVASGQEIASPLYSKLLGRKVEFIQASAQEIDLDAGVVKLAFGGQQSVGFDRMNYTVGSGVELSAVPGVAEYAYSVNDVASARRLSHALAHAAEASRVSVVGAGLTGIEVASEIAGKYPHLRVTLISSGSVGGWMRLRGRAYLLEALKRLGVEIVQGNRVRSFGPDSAELSDGAGVPAAIGVWCGGFRASPLGRASGLQCDDSDRVLVDRKMRSTSHPNILAAGDGALTPAFVAGEPLRMCCQVAGPSGLHAADVVVAETKGRIPKDLHFGYFAQPISLGRHDGLIQFLDRDDRPKESVLTGRRAAWLKEVGSSAALTGFKMERLLPGSAKYPFKEPKSVALLEANSPAND